MFNAGDQIPVIPFSDVVGKGLKAAPEQIAATGLKVGVTLPAAVMVTVAVLVHPRASFTVIVYDPAASPVKILLTWNTTPSLLYCKGTVPPVTEAVIVPSLAEHDDPVDETVIVGPGRLSTVTGIDFTQRFTSRTYNVYDPAATALKTLLAW